MDCSADFMKSTTKDQQLPGMVRPMFGGLLGHVCQHDQFKCVQICDMKSSKGWTLTGLHSFNGWTQIVQVPVFRQIRQINQPCQKEFRKT